MSDRFRNKIISQLADEINHLSGAAFEQFGYKVMPLVQPGDWIERGTTIDGAPRKATVDTSLGGSAYVGEMSSIADYFDDDLDKPKADLQHAYDVHPQVKHIWLLSARTASAGQTTDIDNAISDFKKTHPSVVTATILDARHIAAHVFRHLGSHDLVRDLSHYLPGLTRLAEEHAFSHSIPSITGFTPRVGVEASILASLASSSYVILQGMSGIGKTALAARIAHLQKGDFDNRIWLDAKEIDGVQKLQSVALTRSGVSHNISSLVRNERILLVIDDPGFPLSELADIEYGESKVIVTTQVASGAHVVPIVDLDRQESETVLTSDVEQACPPEVVDRVLEAAGGHPLLLRALNRLAFEHGWDKVVECIATTSMSELEDDRNQNIFRRVLRRQTELAYELQFIRWLASRRFASELSDAASSLLADKLSRRGFLAATTPGYVRIHDLVYNAIQTEIVVEENNRERLCQRIAAFIRAECESDRVLLHRLARMHEEFFARLASGRQPEFVYMAAMQRTGADAINLLGDPVTAAAELSRVSSIADRTLEIRAVIEVVEALFTLRVEYCSRDDARAELRGDMQALASLLEHPGLTTDQREMLEYHRAKMLPRLDAKGETSGRDEAIAIFRALLEQDPSRIAARNQLAKILPAKDSILECERVLERHVENPGAVNWNVVLDSFRLLIRHGGDMAKHEGLLMATIEYAKSIDLSEAVRLVVSVGQRAWFNAPQLLVPMFNALGLSGDAVALSDAFDLAQAHKFVSMESADALRSELIAEALKFYALAKNTKEYERAHYAEALMLVGKYRQAVDVLAAVPSNKRSAFWWQRQAEALSGLGRHAEALAAIDEAIKTIPEPSLLPDFHRSRFRIRRAGGDPAAREDLVAAKGFLPPEHPFLRKLEAESANT